MVGDVSVVQPMTLKKTKRKVEFPKEVPNRGDMVDGEDGVVNAVPPITPQILKLKPDFPNEAQSHGAMVDGADGVVNDDL